MRFVILGGGGCQLNLIKRAKERGHYVILVDYLADAPGRAFADLHVRESTFDCTAVIKAAALHGAEGILTLGTDQPVLTAALVSKALGFKFYLNEETARSVTDKRLMKRIFDANAIPCTAYQLVGSDLSKAAAAQIQFPAVLKPVDSQGQRGVFLVSDADELNKKIPETLSYSRQDMALLEEYYSNDEITVNGWVKDGNAKIISIVDRVTMHHGNHIGICIAHNFPSIYVQEYYDEIEALTQRIVKAFHIKNGPLYFQYFIGKEGIKVNEIAMRIGGAYEDLTMPLISGIDILDLLFQTVERGRIYPSALYGYDFRMYQRCLSTQMFFCKPGTVSYITPEAEIAGMNGVCGVKYLIKEGQQLKKIQNATARAGYILIEGRTFEEMIQNVDHVFEKIKVLNEFKENMIIKYKDYEGKYGYYGL